VTEGVKRQVAAAAADAMAAGNRIGESMAMAAAVAQTLAQSFTGSVPNSGPTIAQRVLPGGSTSYGLPPPRKAAASPALSNCSAEMLALQQVDTSKMTPEQQQQHMKLVKKESKKHEKTKQKRAKVPACRFVTSVRCSSAATKVIAFARDSHAVICMLSFICRAGATADGTPSRHHVQEEVGGVEGPWRQSFHGSHH
jgi:hypothetical protein